METTEIFGLQFVLSLLVVGLIGRWYLAPWLSEKSLNLALGILILPHAFRHLGLTFLTPAVVGADMPASFAISAGYGDFVSGLLAILALVALRQNWKMGLGVVWLFSIVGTADLLNALRQAEAVPHFAAAWFIPTFVVPILLISHVMIYARLLRDRSEKAQLQRSSAA